MKLTRNPNRKWNVSSGEDRFRRGMYTYFWRSTPYPFLKLFNAPDSNTSCTRRDRSNTPLQALTLLNDEAFLEAATALSRRVRRHEPSTDVQTQIQRAFRLCLGRAPQPAELAALLELSHESASGNTDDSLLGVSRVLLNLDEFITRE